MARTSGKRDKRQKDRSQDRVRALRLWERFRFYSKLDGNPLEGFKMERALRGWGGHIRLATYRD